MTQEFVTLPRDVVEQALDALYCTDSEEGSPAYNFELKAIEELRAALEQQHVEQGPFTVLVRKHSWLENQWEAAPRGFPDYGKQWADERINVYTHPQPKGEPMTPEAVSDLWIKHARNGAYIHAFAQAIERAHGIGNKT